MFSDPLKAIWKTLAMMTGELEYNDLFPDKMSGGAGTKSNFAVPIIFTTFLITIAIVLMNLLVGIVVHDVNKIKSLALVTKLERKVELVKYLSTTSDNIKLIFKIAIQIFTVLLNYGKGGIKKNEPQADYSESKPFIRKYVQSKEGLFDSEPKNAALKIALFNAEVHPAFNNEEHLLDAFGDSVDAPLRDLNPDLLKNQLRRNNLKMKQLTASLVAVTQENEEVLTKLNLIKQI